jgi:hypothetical protein
MSEPTSSPGPYWLPGPTVPHGDAYDPGSEPPRSHRTLVIVAILLGIAVVFAGTYVVGWLSAPLADLTPLPMLNVTPTAGTVARTGFTLAGSTLSGPGFTARAPSGWTLGADNGVSTNDGVIENGADNSLAYFASDPNPAATKCSNAMGSYRAKLGGTVVDLPNVTWANGTAVVKELETTYSNGQAIGIDVYCVDRPNNTSAALLSIAAPEHQATNKAAAESLLASWFWT